LAAIEPVLARARLAAQTVRAGLWGRQAGDGVHVERGHRRRADARGVCGGEQAKLEPLPYLYIWAFIANAARFVLPISNPANLSCKA
jgi:hypothetical protein